MTVKSSTEQIESDVVGGVVDDIVDEVTPVAQSAEAIDMNKLAMLKAKSQAKQTEQKVVNKVAKKERSIVFGIVGSGQAGSRIAEAFYKAGYEAIQPLVLSRILSACN